MRRIIYVIYMFYSIKVSFFSKNIMPISLKCYIFASSNFNFSCMPNLHYFEIDDDINRWHSKFRCPFGFRDLSSDDFCGFGKPCCKYFVKYSWLGEHDHHLVCKCNLPLKGSVVQLTFDFDL